MAGRSSAAALKRFFPTRSAATRAMVEVAVRVVDLPVNLLITGETGSGKDYLAEAVHRAGPRRDAPFLRLDCGAIPHELFEAELFGHEKGAFTDARQQRRGRLEMADRGTVYLDDISSLDASLQPKLLRLIQERRFTRVGGNRSIDVDLRFIASSQLPVEDLARDGAMRADLFYRLNVVSLRVPPLRERREDVVPLARSFVADAARRFRREPLDIDDDAASALAAYRWPGNIRQLRNAIDHAFLSAAGPSIAVADLPLEIVGDAGGAVEYGAANQWSLADMERAYIVRAVAASRGNFSAAARLLGINRKTLLEKRKRYGL